MTFAACNSSMGWTGPSVIKLRCAQAFLQHFPSWARGISRIQSRHCAANSLNCGALLDLAWGRCSTKVEEIQHIQPPLFRLHKLLVWMGKRPISGKAMWPREALPFWSHACKTFSGGSALRTSTLQGCPARQRATWAQQAAASNSRAFLAAFSCTGLYHQRSTRPLSTSRVFFFLAFALPVFPLRVWLPGSSIVCLQPLIQEVLSCQVDAPSIAMRSKNWAEFQCPPRSLSPLLSSVAQSHLLPDQLFPRQAGRSAAKASAAPFATSWSALAPAGSPPPEAGWQGALSVLHESQLGAPL